MCFDCFYSLFHSRLTRALSAPAAVRKIAHPGFRAGGLLLIFGLLSGCALNQNKQTLTAIENLDTRLQTRLQALENHNQAQAEQLKALHQQLRQSDKALAQLKNDQNRLLSLAQQQQQQQTSEPNNLTTQAESQQDKVVLGSREWVWLDAPQENFRARVDSGATTSSMHATDLVFFERNGDEWVRFNLSVDDGATEESNRRMIEAPIVRWVRIIQASSDEAERRPVIEAWMQVGNLREKAEFTLANRENMSYPILLGREFFKDIALIDVGRAYIQPKHKPNPPTSAP